MLCGSTLATGERRLNEIEKDGDFSPRWFSVFVILAACKIAKEQPENIDGFRYYCRPLSRYEVWFKSRKTVVISAETVTNYTIDQFTIPTGRREAFCIAAARLEIKK